MREKHSELPNSQELQAILEREAKRPITPSKKDVHFVHHENFQALLKAYGLSMELLTAAEFSFDNGLLERAEEELEKLVAAVTSAEPSAVQVAALNHAYDYLAEEDAVEPANILFVFGSKQRYRIDRAIELFTSGMAPLMVISGNHTHYETDGKPEASSLKAYAVQQGIPEDRIMTETRSISLPDNVRSSLNLLESLEVPCARIILVNSPFAQRRGWACFNKFSADGTKLIRINAATSESFSREQWYKDFEAAKVVLNEYVKMRLGILLNTA